MAAVPSPWGTGTCLLYSRHSREKEAGIWVENKGGMLQMDCHTSAQWFCVDQAAACSEPIEEAVLSPFPF